MPKKWVFLVLAVVIILAFPLSNLLRSKSDTALTAGISDPHFQKVAPVLAEKCTDCHSSDPDLPFYAGFPFAKGMIEEDRQKGLTFLNMDTEFFGPSSASEAALAKTQAVMESDSMPPMRYKLLHWNAALDDQEREQNMTWIRFARARANGSEDGGNPIYGRPLLPLAPARALDAAKVELGRKLFHDNRLSGDDSLSCASCHDLKKGGTDQQRYATGINGQKGNINSPTVYNAAHNLAQFWDGRAHDLQEQANGPVNNPVEMGSNWEQALGKLAADKEYVAAFNEIYPDGITSDNATDAIAAFEKSLITTNSRFDKFLEGDDGALTGEEKEGYRLFAANQCNTCHVGQAMGGTSFEKFGLYDDYFKMRGNVEKPDYGRFNVTGQEQDRYRFKVPLLRNIALTYPYFHDGSTSDLHEVVKTMGVCQSGKSLTDEETEAIVKFLGTLTGEYQGEPL